MLAAVAVSGVGDIASVPMRPAPDSYPAGTSLTGTTGGPAPMWNMFPEDVPQEQRHQNAAAFAEDSMLSDSTVQRQPCTQMLGHTFESNRNDADRGCLRRQCQQATPRAGNVSLGHTHNNLSTSTSSSGARDPDSTSNIDPRLDILQEYGIDIDNLLSSLEPERRTSVSTASRSAVGFSSQPRSSEDARMGQNRPSPSDALREDQWDSWAGSGWPRDQQPASRRDRNVTKVVVIYFDEKRRD
ncbi:hypothetical protein F5Y15DRAFT_68085 [Xylariaceae sp. FL0016]|nr:hypothetical protein F5Y15DRAFT_68085 [Xylariaceae sp. FL0016]